jgi:hypothetical protein
VGGWGWVGVGGWVAGQVRLYNHTFGHPIGWVFPLGRVWQYINLDNPVYLVVKVLFHVSILVEEF